MTWGGDGVVVVCVFTIEENMHSCVRDIRGCRIFQDTRLQQSSKVTALVIGERSAVNAPHFKLYPVIGAGLFPPKLHHRHQCSTAEHIV